MAPKILLTGATGYIGGRLLKALLQSKCSLRCLVRRSPSFLNQEKVQLIEGDICDRAALEKALEGIETAYYLIHSLATSLSKFEAQDRKAAELFAEVAKQKGLKRIIYLGGLGSDKQGPLSPHLRSRQEVGRVLKMSGCEVIEFRASIILGSGSASYEIIRGLVKKLPFMIAPRWVKSLCQPIYIEDVIHYLISALKLPLKESQIVEIGGPDKVGYIDLLKQYAKEAKRPCHILTLPILTPKLSSLWLGLVTPVYAQVGRALIESVKNDTILEDFKAKELFPFDPIDYKTAIHKCIDEEKNPSRNWMSAFSAKGYSIQRLTEGKRIHACSWEGSVAINKPKKTAFEKIRDAKNFHDWVYAKPLWIMRGLIDRLLGGVGFQRKSQLTGPVNIGDIVNFWRVEEIIPEESIRLLAEMNMPGIAHFTFSLKEESASSCKLTLKAEFEAAGLWGLIYWGATYPFHLFIFPGTLKKLKKHIESSVA